MRFGEYGSLGYLGKLKPVKNTDPLLLTDRSAIEIILPGEITGASSGCLSA